MTISPLICPVCAESLWADEKHFTCKNGHSFDRARQGYVNLSRQHTSSDKRHGDDKRMISARTEFLQSDAYSSLAKKLIALSLPLLQPNDLFVDAGCGEGYYTEKLISALAERSTPVRSVGVDLSKEALRTIARRCPDLYAVVASVYHLPVATDSCALLWDVFAPLAPEEYGRALKSGGHLIRVFPLEEHLMGLKEQIYDQPYQNKVEIPEIPDFDLIETHLLREELHLTDSALIRALFEMTPYYYKTSAADQEKLASLTELTTPLAFGLSVYRKK